MNASALMFASLVLWTTLPLQAAGVVEVNFVEPSRFTDAGRGEAETARTVSALGAHIQHLGQRLPDGQTLRVEVLDIDLAGELRPRRGHEIRVLTGGADWPRMLLRYTLLERGHTLKAGEAAVNDMNYLQHGPALARHQDLVYERQMLERWFEAQFAAPR